MIKIFFAALLLLNTIPQLAWAYPEMVRHGYTNCTTCHVSPTGGGVLTQYGRELSREILSTWSHEGESNWAYGLVKTPEWLIPGGEYRSVYLYKDTPNYRDGRSMFMQADLEAAAVFGKFTADATLGYQNPGVVNTVSDHLISRRHWLMFKPTDELALRAGRFMPAYGINTPDHIITTKKGLGWDEGTDGGIESYNVEASWISEGLNVYGTGILGRLDDSTLDRETGGALTASVPLADHYKLGASFFRGSKDSEGRIVYGPFGILGFTPHFYLLSEIDFQHQTRISNGIATGSTDGVVNFQRLGYEVFQGFHAIFQQELSRLDFSKDSGLGTAYTVGFQFFPRPHFDFQFSWQRMYRPATNSDWIDYAYLMTHFYL